MASVAAINSLGGHAHNPRGNLWFNDDSTYGHKLLMKMGWNKGKGLGKNEDGIKENVKVKFRNTNSGLGFKDDAHANVMKTEYESILKNLAAEYSNPGTTNLNEDINSSKEPVHRSKVIKSKLRYPKLFFGKDVTKYSEKDMKSIFICSTPLKSIEGESENGVTSTTDNKDLENDPPKTSTTYSSSLSVSDYFAKKMEEKKKNSLSKHSNNALTDDENITSKIKHKDSRGNVEKKESVEIEELNKVTTDIEGIIAENLAMSKKKSRKRKKKYEDSIKEIEMNSNEIEPNVDMRSEQVLENSACQNMCVVENITDQNSFSRPNKKRKMCLTFENSVESFENTFPSEVEIASLSTEKKKKKSKKKSAAIKLCSEDFMSENYATEIYKETNNNISLEPTEDGMSNNKDDFPKKKKKSKKKLKEKLRSCLKSKHGSYSLKNVSFNETVSYRIIDSEFESVDPLACDENLDENSISSNLIDSEQNNCSDDTSSEKKRISSESISADNISTEEQNKISDESDIEYKLSYLPSSKSSHYNSWVEDQRQAVKMQLYKYMLKNIKHHKILKTTNLLSIKGYGNWGY